MADTGPQLALNIALDDEARFETFYAGRNKPVVGALRACLPPGLWLAGAPDSGRSHLLQALAAAQPRGHAVYLPLGSGLPPDAIEGLDASLTICLDDVDSVAGETGWERSLFLLAEQTLMHQGRLVVSAAERPGDAGFALRDLESRLSALPVFRLRPLTDEERVAALRKRAQARQIELPEDAARYMLTHLPRDFRSLLDALRHLDRESLAARRRLTVRFVASALRRRDAG